MLAQPFIFHSQVIYEKINSCLVTIDDLKRIYNLLREKSKEAALYDLEEIKPNPEITVEKMQQYRDQIMPHLEKLWVEIVGSNGEYIAGDDVSIFNDPGMPEHVTSVKIVSSKAYSTFTNRTPKNTFEMQLDFRKTSIFDMSKTFNPENSNQSYISIFGIHDTWVNGVRQKILSLLYDKRTNRNWLYSNFSYDVLLYVIFLPLNFRVTYLIGQYLNLSSIGNPLQIGVYVYLFVFILMIFRVFVFNYSKWIFPLVELQSPKSSSLKHRAALGVITLSLIAGAIYDFLPHLFRTIF